MKRLRAILITAIILCMCFTSSAVGVFAADTDNTDPTQTETSETADDENISEDQTEETTEATIEDQTTETTEEATDEDDGNDDPGKFRLSGGRPAEFLGSAISTFSSSSSWGSTHASKFSSGYTIQKGIDVSEWQGSINWTKVKNAGIQFAIIRVACRGYGSAGTLMEDSQAKTNIKNAYAAGVPVGVYIFSQATSTSEAKEEADYIIKLVEKYGYGSKVTLPVVMDFEYAAVGTGRLYNAHLSKQKATDICNAFCKEVKAKGYTPMVYANASMLSDQMYASQVSSSYKIWLAQWASKASYTGDYEYWQYSDAGSVSGISGNVDMDYRYIKQSNKVTNLKASSKTKTSISLSWSGLSGYTGYRVYRKNSKGEWERIAQTTSKTYKDSSLTKGKEYSYKVRAYKTSSSGSNTYSEYSSVLTTATKMDGTVTLKATPSTYSKVKLSWNKVSGATGYKVERYDSSSGAYKVIKTISKNSTTSYTDTGRALATSYKYRVRAYKKLSNCNSYTSYSDVKSAKTKSTAKGTVTGSAVNIRSGAGTSYKIYKTVKKGTKLNITGRSGSWYKTSVKVSGKSKTAYIKKDYVKLSSSSSSVGKPTLKKKKSSYSSVTLSWKKVSGASGYQIQRYSKSAKKYKTVKTITKGSTTSYKNSYLNSGTSYKYRIRAYKKSNGKKTYGSYSSVLTAKTGKSVKGKTTGTEVNVRSGAGINHKVVTNLAKKGTSVTITGSRKNWYRVSVNVNGHKKTGYIKKTYVKRT